MYVYISKKTGSIKKLCKIIFLTARPVTAATVDLYYAVIINMLSSPSKIHYQFNLCDISKVRDSAKEKLFLEIT
jgi:hypothetical protein